MARASLQHNQRQPLRRVGLLPYTLPVPAQQGRGFDSPKQRRSSRAGYPNAAFCCVVRFAFYGRACGEGRESLPVPLPGLSPRTSCHPRLTARAAGFRPVAKEPIHG